MSILALGRKQKKKIPNQRKGESKKETKFPIEEWEKSKKKEKSQLKSGRKQKRERKFPIKDRKKTEEICRKERHVSTVCTTREERRCDFCSLALFLICVS